MKEDKDNLQTVWLVMMDTNSNGSHQQKVVSVNSTWTGAKASLVKNAEKYAETYGSLGALSYPSENMDTANIVNYDTVVWWHIVKFPLEK